MSKPTTSNIVILGGSFAGTGLTHYLLRHVLPTLNKHHNFRIVLVSPSTHVFHKFAAPRMVARPDLMPFEKLITPLRDAFAEYPPEIFELIHAAAISVDDCTKTVTLQANTNGNLKEWHLPFRALVIATGASSTSPLWSPVGSLDETKKELYKTNKQIREARSIAIVGGGAVGVEVAGELGFDLGTKEITLFSGTTALLGRVRPDVGAQAEKYLRQMGVMIVHEVKVKSERVNPNGRTTLSFDDGTEMEVDVFLDARGLRPNTKFLPPEWLNSWGYVDVDEYLKVRRASSKTHVYALGDVTSYSKGGILDVVDAVVPLAATIEFDFSGSQEGVRWQTAYKGQEKQMMVVPVGRSKAVGVILDYWVPSFLGWCIKGRTYMVEKARETAFGARWRKKQH